MPTWPLSNLKLPSDFHGSKSLPLSMPQSLLCARGGGVFCFPILTPPGLEEGSVGQGGQRKAAGVTSPSRCSPKAPPSYQGALLGSPSMCCGQASGSVFAGTSCGSPSTGCRAVLSSSPPLPITLDPPLRIHPVALASCWRPCASRVALLFSETPG